MVFIVGPGSRVDCDVDYTFGAVYGKYTAGSIPERFIARAQLSQGF